MRAPLTFIYNILDCQWTICLDSNPFKPLPYKKNIVSETKELTLPSRIESVDEAAMAADEFVKRLGLGDDFISAIDLAIRESVANAVKHGNKFDESKNVEVRLAHENGGLRLAVRDHGVGFDLDSIPDPTNPENLL
jgi:serine/threonine-protein kinase RsbW